jgi:hypothetical protein
MVNSLAEAEQIGFELSKKSKMQTGVLAESADTHTGPLKVSSLLLFTVYEKMAVERIVGKERCEHLLTSTKGSFLFR